MPVAAGAFHMLDGDVLDGQFGEPAPDRRAADRRPGCGSRHERSPFHCAMAQDGAIDVRNIGRVYCRRMVRAAVPGDAAVFVDDRRSDGCAFRNEARSFSSGRARRRTSRALAQGVESRLCAMLGLADDTGKIAVAHDGDETGHRARHPPSIQKFRARVLRPQHAAVQHSRQRLIVDESRPAQNLVRNVDPLN